MSQRSASKMSGSDLDDRSPSREMDDEFDYGGASASNRAPATRPAFLVPNQHHDEVVELSDDGASSAPSPTPDRSGPRGVLDASATSRSRHTVGDEEELEDGEEYDDDEEEEEVSPTTRPAAEQTALYNAGDYKDLKVSPEILDLFDYIGRYKPQDIELETPLAPFIPDYIPSVGDIDAFIKIPRPDGKPDGLGLIVLDEPGPNQTDPTVLDLQLRVLSKQSSASASAMTVRSIENADKCPKNITAWISSIQDLHRQKPPPTVSYARLMPDVNELMQLWPSDFEALLNQLGTPGVDIEMDLKSTGRLACALLDIPVYNSLKESLHLLFTLYIEFKSQGMNQSTTPVPDMILAGTQQLEINGERISSPLY